MPRTDDPASAASGEDARLRFPRAIWIGHARLNAVELLAVIGGLAVFGNLGWDSALWDGRLQLALHLIGGCALVAGIFALLRGASYPRSRLDLPILALLVALGIASIRGSNHELAAWGMACSMGLAASLPLAVAAVSRWPFRTALHGTI